MTNERIMVLGSQGQIGTELTTYLRKNYGDSNVIACDVKDVQSDFIYEKVDALDGNRILEVVKKYNIKEIYLLAALLSATAEKNPAFGWDLNMNSLFNVLNLARDKYINKIYWPSSIAVFGGNTPKWNTPQRTIMEPSTVYGISKVAGESWCEWYHHKYGIDVRSLRYPGLISYKSAPGGGTTDYAVHIFYEAIKSKKYDCFISENTTLPMMYMDDAIRATVEIMTAPANKVKIRSSYNLSGFSFSPKQVAEEIKKHIPEFSIIYTPDFRDKIAAGWPSSIDDAEAQKDWGWKTSFDLEQMTNDMLVNLKSKLEGAQY
jgi:nucleoside-diphosphate-sugar epimerase